MGFIDPHSEHDLYDILNGRFGMNHAGRPDGSYEFYGFHLVPQGNGTYTVQYDGHAGRVGTLDPEEYDDVLELVDDLMSYVFRVHEYDYQDDKEELVEWAGKIMVDEGDERAAEHPDLYIEVPMGPV